MAQTEGQQAPETPQAQQAASGQDASEQAAPAPASAALTIERLYASPGLSGPTPRALALSPDGAWLTMLRPRPDNAARFDLWAMDTATGEWRMLVDSLRVGTGAQLSEEERMQRERARIGGLQGIVTYAWAPDGHSILVPLDGDLYLATLDGEVRRLTATEASELNPAISPAGGYVSFVRDQNLVVADLATGTEHVVTQGGGGAVHWGEAEFVAQEEMARSTGYWWAPGDRMIAVERFDETPVDIVTRSAIGADGTRVYQQRYPRAGTANVLVELYVLRPDGSGQVQVDLGSDPDIYLARVHWAPDGSALFVERENRAQTVLDVLRVDPETGASTVLFTERAAERSWINLSDTFRVLRDGSVLWWSERDGHGHLYRWKDGTWTQITSGPWEVADVVGVDEDARSVYFLGNRDGVLERHLYVTSLDAPGEIARLTETGWWHGAVMDNAARRIIVTRSNPEQPPQVYLADTTGRRIAWIEENDVHDPHHPYNPYLASHRERRFGTLTGPDGTTLYWEMITPPLVPGRRYPVFFQHYGGPSSQTVSRAWGGALQQYIVDRGYIWFQIDNRGSPNRGKAFEDAIYHAMGSVEVEDQLAGANYLRSLDFVDPRMIVTYGWSYGGYMTLKMLEAAPGVFAAGISGAPVSMWELYDTHYTERYMGDPRQVPEAYRASDTVANAARIRDPLLLIHGMADDNVVLEHSTVMMARMQEADVPFELMLYPGYTHRVGGAVGPHLTRTMLDFLDRAIAGAE